MMEEELQVVGQCRTFLRALRETAGYFLRRLSVLHHPLERWVPVQIPDSVKSVLFVCRGNICRSPLAAVYFQSLASIVGRQIRVRSAGLETMLGKPAHTKAKMVALRERLSLDEHLTTQVHSDLIDQSDLIVVMEVAHKVRLNRLYPKAKAKVILLGRLDNVGPLEIADPYNRTDEDFRLCFQQIRRCCDALADRLNMACDKVVVGRIVPASSERR